MIPPAVEIDEILSERRIEAAWRRVRGNRGAPGSDLVTIDDLDGSFAQAWTPVRDAVLAGSYRPQPLRVVPVPKNSGGIREHCLGVLVVEFL